ncbi:MAG: alpha/beta hydrolase [Saprospiraceae bacterium]
MLKRISLTLLFIVLAFYFGASWFFSNLILNPPQGDPIQRTEAMLKIAGPNAKPINNWLNIPDTFALEARDGKTIRGWYFKAKDEAECAVIMAHGWSSSRLHMNKYMPLFEDCPCDIITYDQRGHNKSETAYGTGGIKEAEDLLMIHNWLKDETGLKNEDIGWIGISWGGATVLQAGATDEDVAFIVSDSPFQNWYSAVMERAVRDYGSWITAFVPMIKTIVWARAGVNFDKASALKEAAKIKEPVFLIHSKADSATASTQSVNIAAQLNPSSSEFHHTEWGNDHADDIKNNLAEYEVLFDAFIEKYAPNFSTCQQASVDTISNQVMN